MNIESYFNYCLELPGITEEFPFDEKTLVFKVKGKIYSLTDVDTFESINLKYDPYRAIIFRDMYEEIIPGYHMNKKHWNTVKMTGSLSNELIFELIDHSYELVKAKLPKKLKDALDNP